MDPTASQHTPIRDVDRTDDRRLFRPRKRSAGRGIAQTIQNGNTVSSGASSVSGK
jgi:hypothetical protein